MEYSELITRVQQASLETPDADALLEGMRNTMHRRRQNRRWLVMALYLIVVGGTIAALLPTTPAGQPMALVEKVSRQLDVPHDKMPAPLAGYRNSIHNRQIYTLL